MSNSSIRIIDRTPLTGTSSAGQSGPGSNSNEWVLHIPQSSKAGTLPSDDFVSYSGYLLVGSYPSAEMHSVYSTASADWAVDALSFG